MLRMSLTSLIVALHTSAILAADQTVSQFLSPPPLGKLIEESEIRPSVAVQETAGAHQGHRILNASLPLLSRAAKPTPELWGYALRYHACLELDKHKGGVEVCPKEGGCGIGMTRPSASNWYSGGFIGVSVDGKRIGAYKPRLTRLRYDSGAVAARALYALPAAKVELTFLQLPNENFCRILGRVEGKATSTQLVLRCYPCATKPTGERVAWSATRQAAKAGTLLPGMRDCWFLLADDVYDRAKSRKGEGPCAVMFDPGQVKVAKAALGQYSCSVTLSLRSGAGGFHLAVWEFRRWTNEKALAYMRDLDSRVTAPLGLSPTADVVAQPGAPRAIVLDGRPAATIVLAPRPGQAFRPNLPAVQRLFTSSEPDERVLQAALEVQDYVQKATGAVLPILQDPAQAKGHVITLAVQAPPKGESHEAFRIKVSSRRTDVIGNSPLAALHGAYDLLERGVGVRWYIASPLGEVVPKRDTLVLPELDLTQSPSFPMRWIGRGEWSLRNKQNRCDDGFLIHPGIYHTQNRIVSHRKYFKRRPDFFALIKGERCAEHQCKWCYSNADLVREAAKNMAAMLDANPHIKLISLSPTDGQQWCECEACVAKDEKGVDRDRAKSRRSLLFYNAVAAELRKTHPDVRMLVGAYNVYNWPPQDKGIKADPMIDVIITHYENYCMAHPVGDETCPLNKRYVQLIKEWQALGCHVYFYEYYWKVNWLDLPWPIVHSVREDMKWYKENHCRGVFTQFNRDCVWQQFPAHYVAARLLWDVDADVDKIMDEMFRDLFGKAGPHMKAYWDLIESQMATCGQHFPGRGLSFGPAVYTDEVRAQVRKHYDAAVAANDDPTVAERLGKIGLSLEYTDRLMLHATLRQASTSEPDPAKAYELAKQALGVLDTLVTEVRTDRAKWSGVVSTSVVSTRSYFGKILPAWERAVARKRVAIQKAVAALPKTWRFCLDKDDVGQKQKWFEPGFDDSPWKPIEIGKTWESQGYEYDGFAWYRVKFRVRKQWLKKRISIFFGAVDGEAWVYWNGRLLGHNVGWDKPFSFELDPKLVKTDAANTIAVRVFDGSNAGGIYKMGYLIEAPKPGRADPK